MPKVRLELTWACARQILSLLRIPISPLRQVGGQKEIYAATCDIVNRRV